MDGNASILLMIGIILIAVIVVYQGQIQKEENISPERTKAESTATTDESSKPKK